MKYLTPLSISFLLAIAHLALGQEAKLKVFGEQKEDAVYLAWLPEYWPTQMSGIVVKRKINEAEWQVVSSNEIIPASYRDKDFSNTEPLPAEQLRLRNKFDSLLSSGKAKPISAEEYRNNILSKSTAASSIAFIFAMDFDLMLLNGFGLIDRDVDYNGRLSYGFFAVTNGITSAKPIKVIEILKDNTGPINLSMTPSLEVVGSNRQLRLHWNFSLEEFRNKNIKGFDLYKSSNGEPFEKVNRNIIWITSKQDPVDLNYLVGFPAGSITYSARPVSYFNTPGVSVELKFEPKIYTIDIPAPVLSSNINNNEAVFNWQLDHGFDSLLVGFEFQRKRSGKAYELLQTLPTNARTYRYKLADGGEEAQFRLVLETKRGKELWSNERFIRFVPKVVLPVPGSLNAKIVTENGKNFIQLEWEYRGDSSQVSFRIFTDGPRGNLIHDSGFSGAISSPYLIPINSSIAQLQHFAIQAMTADRTKSELSNTVEIITPTTRLPPISIEKASSEPDGVHVSWRFSQDILDLKGFEILVDGESSQSGDLIANQLRSMVLENIDPGKHKLEIVAITQYDYESKSSPYMITVK